MNTDTAITIAVIISPGRALFGSDLLDLTVKSKDLGINLTGADIRNARPCPETGGVYVRGGCEWKHYTATGKLDN
jgi:hypothetical protein